MTHAISRQRFGSTDLTVSQYGLGCARIGGIFQSDPSAFVKLLCAANDAGINFFDTADIYSQGESERLLGRALGRRRNDIVIATKAGYLLPAQRRLVARIKPFVRPLIRLTGFRRQHVPGSVRGSLAQDFSGRHLRKAVEDSLRRLRTDRIDLFQLHSPPAAQINQGDWLDLLSRLKWEGKLRHYGISCDSTDAALAALGQPGISSIQIPISLLDATFLGLLPQAMEKGVGVIARECLANGLLVKDPSTIDWATYCQSDDERQSKAIALERLRAQAASQGCPLASLALTFTRELPGVSVSLIGASRLEQLQSLLAYVH